MSCCGKTVWIIRREYTPLATTSRSRPCYSPNGNNNVYICILCAGTDPCMPLNKCSLCLARKHFVADSSRTLTAQSKCQAEHVQDHALQTDDKQCISILGSLPLCIISATSLFLPSPTYAPQLSYRPRRPRRLSSVLHVHEVVVLWCRPNIVNSVVPV